MDLARSVPIGVLFPLEFSVLLTIAIKRFDAPGTVKALVASAAGFGLLRSPMVTSLARRSRHRAMVVASDAGLIFGAVALGIRSAGGDLMWSLWVTKFAPAERVADYMGLHTFFTGVVAQAWRDGARQARLARLLRGVDESALTSEQAGRVGTLLRQSKTADVIDAALADIVRDGDEVLTSDPDDMENLLTKIGRVAIITHVNT